MAKEKRRRGDRRSDVGRSPTTSRPAERALAREPSVPGSLTSRGIDSDDACARLRRIRHDETENAIRRRRAHTDDLIRVLRNLTALALFSSMSLTLIVYAGVRTGIPPEVCLAGSLSLAVVLIKTFAKAFESVRPSLPDAPRDPPSIDEP